MVHAAVRQEAERRRVPLPAFRLQSGVRREAQGGDAGACSKDHVSVHGLLPEQHGPLAYGEARPHRAYDRFLVSEPR